MTNKTEHVFHFVTQLDLVELTGLKVKNLSELLAQLKSASGSILYFHTHHFLKQHQFLSPEPPNDFAYWVGYVLQETRLGEQLAAIDTVRFDSLLALRDKLCSVIETYLAKDGSTRVAPEGAEFHLMKSQSFVLPTAYQAQTLEEFAAAVKKVSVRSLYHHMFQARLRLGKPTNDFSHWLDSELQESGLAKAIGKLDPYTQTLENLRDKIGQLVESRLKSADPEKVYATR